MTQEEKSKAYDEAIIKAKSIIKNYSKDKASITVLEHIFPELKEGEDERIKKEILELVSIAGNGNQFEEIKDWLEKKTIIIPKFRVGDVMRTLQEAADNVTGGLPVVTSIDEEYYHCTNELIAIKDQDDYEYLPMNRKQKTVINPKFRVGDEIREALIKAFKEYPKNSVKYWHDIAIEDIITWFEKQGEQSVEPNWCHHKVDFSGCSEEYRKAYYDGWNSCNMQHSQCSAELGDVVKCLINGFKYYYDETNEEIVWGTYESSMPVKHIIEVLERLIKMHDHIHKVNE